MINYNEYKVTGTATWMNRTESYILVKDSQRYIFKDERGYGFDGHHSTAEEAIKSFVDWNGNTVSITRK